VKAGRLRERIEFQRRDSALNEYGERVQVWRFLASEMAAVEPLAGREFFTALQTQTDISIRIVCRYSETVSQVTAHDRIVHNGMVYDIRHPPIDPNMRHRELHFMCTRHVDQ
jgi:SPP1 family predicted phage head-tail adaptor